MKRFRQTFSVRFWFFGQRFATRKLIILRSVVNWAFIVALLEELTRRFLIVSPQEGRYSFPLWLLICFTVLVVALTTVALAAKIRRFSLQGKMGTRLHAIRGLQRMVDMLREKARNDENEQHLTGDFKDFLEKVLEKINYSLFPSLEISMTFMQEDEGVLRIVAFYPAEMPIKKDFTIPLNGDTGYARIAYLDGKTVYVPYLKWDWGVAVYPSPSPMGGVRYRFEGKDLWRDSGRKDFGCLVSVPAVVATQTDPYSIPYGVLNLESEAKKAFQTDDFHFSYIAASILAQGAQIYEEGLKQLEGRSV